MTLASCLLVLGWTPMLLGVWIRGPRGLAARPEAPEGDAPRAPRPSLETRLGVGRFDRILLLLTWVACAALTVSALWFLRRDPAPARLAAGTTLFLSGMALWTYARWALGEHYMQVAAPPAALVTRGPYRIVRHPLYLGTALGCLGQALAAGALAPLAMWAALVGVLLARAAREERLLRVAFGSAWDAYAQRTARALPFLY